MRGPPAGAGNKRTSEALERGDREQGRSEDRKAVRRLPGAPGRVAEDSSAPVAAAGHEHAKPRRPWLPRGSGREGDRLMRRFGPPAGTDRG
jgi:hypothetical protein